MEQPDYLISTPENVDLHLELAGLGNRAYAAIIDQIIIWLSIFAVVLVCLIVGIAIEQSAMLREHKIFVYWSLLALVVVASFLINFVYFIVFEGAWSGQTPGKRLAQIRVIESTGQPIGWSSVFIRNLLRLVDMGLGLIGMIPMFFDRNERRFGDYAAGTVVIRERLPELKGIAVTKSSDQKETGWDVGQLTPDEYQLLTTFLKRREIMAKNHRPKVAGNLAAYFRQKLDVMEASDSPEIFLERLYTEYMNRAKLIED